MGMLFVGMTALVGCKKETSGCTDYAANNYDSSADKDDNSCVYDDINAVFTFNVSSSTPGKVTFVNLSEGADYYEWKFGDGDDSPLDEPTHTYSENGSYTVKLTAKSFTHDITNSTIKTVNINNISTATTGQCIFWTATDTYGQIDIKINGGNVGTITVYSNSGLAPSCGTNGYVTVDLPDGVYSFTAESTDGNWSWNGSFQITNGECTKKQLT